MQSALRLLCCIAAAACVGGFRVRTRSHSNSTALVSKSADCAALGNITVIGHNIGQAAQLLCQFWPVSRFGPFPVENAQTLADLVNRGADIWQKVKELAKGREGNSPFCWKKAAARELISTMLLDSHMNFSQDLSTFNNCDMQVFGRCYGSCPAGKKPIAIVGGFVPVCTSDCRQSSTHGTGCGFGCSTGFRTCLSTLMDQAGYVATTVGQVASYMTGNPLIHEVIDKVLRLVDFFVDTMFQVVAVAKHVYKEWPREEADLGVIIALLQFVLEHAQEIGKSFQFLQGQFGETLEMIMELLDAEFEWKEINLKFIADTILKHGQAILDSAFEFAEVFVFPTC